MFHASSAAYIIILYDLPCTIVGYIVVVIVSHELSVPIDVPSEQKSLFVDVPVKLDPFQ
jgi:hypothetical protein